MSDEGRPNLTQLVRDMLDHPDRVIHERIAWQAVLSLVDDLSDDAEVGRRVRHAVTVYRDIMAQPEPLVFPDAARYVQ
jgi:hypothetical protein